VRRRGERSRWCKGGGLWELGAGKFVREREIELGMERRSRKGAQVFDNRM
jgi:hypothetical protein